MSKVKLNQIVALNAPKKGEFEKLKKVVYHVLQKPEPFFGEEATYTPKDNEGEQLPPASSKVQLKVKDVLEQVKTDWVNLIDLILTNDTGNQQAKANVVLEDGTVLAENVPISTLLFLEKQLVDLGTLLSTIPMLPLSQNWVFNTNEGLYETATVQSVRTAKVEEPLIIVAATKEFPAQAKTVIRDKTVGTWDKKKTSSALPFTEVDQMKKRLARLREAVIKAREQANSLEIEQLKSGEAILNFIFSN